MHDHGWKVVEGGLVVEWDDPENCEQVKESVRLLLRGCGCKRGCNTKRCSCCKAERRCGPGCRCSNCQNVPSSPQVSGAGTSVMETSDDIEQEELVDDNNVRQSYHTELVDDNDGGEPVSDEDDDEMNLADGEFDDDGE